MDENFNYKICGLSFFLGFITIVVAFTIFQVSALYDVVGTQQDYNNFFCNENNKIK